MLLWCWTIIYDTGPTLYKHWVHVSCVRCYQPFWHQACSHPPPGEWDRWSTWWSLAPLEGSAPDWQQVSGWVNNLYMGRKCEVNVKKMWRQCEENVKKIWRQCEQNVKKMWNQCEENVKAMWRKCEQNVKLMWRKRDVNVKKMWRQC